METQEELAYLEQKLPRLRARLSCLQQLYRDLQQKTREDFDEEEEVGDRMNNTSDEEQ
ncbi:hypothetical protein [Coleofasciculus sp.]|uniref:hypothetical protein n=1 Tax=Coleofasciculus sp. TaxID=3100458 RepID=UPI0039FA1397